MRIIHLLTSFETNSFYLDLDKTSTQLQNIICRIKIFIIFYLLFFLPLVL